MMKDARWKNIGEVWQLIAFNESSPPTWQDFLFDQQEYWGENRISGANSKDWLWKGSREKWIEHMRLQYKDYVEYCTKWFGKFSIGESIPVLSTDNSNVIKLCVINNDRTSWADTIELWLQREIKLIPPTSKLVTEIFTFSTTVKENGDPRASWSQGLYETVIEDGMVTIGDAVFKIKNT